jgi:hypothetical protein
MAIPTSVSDLSATPVNNSPIGTDVIGTTLDDYIRSHAAIIRQVSDAKADLTALSASSGASLVGFIQSGTGAVATTGQAEFRKQGVRPETYGAVGDGATSDSAAFVLAAALGRPLFLTSGKNYVIDVPTTIGVSIYGEGPADGQTTITLTGTGQLIPGNWHCHWDGFLIESSVNNLVFVKNAQSFFTFTNYRLFATGGATGQTGIEFDCSANSVYFCNISNFKIKLAYPIAITGALPNVFNANVVGGSLRDDYQDFASAISISGVAACDANQFAGYFEVGTNLINFTATAFRQNRIRVISDAVTRVFNSSVAISDQNIWEILSGGFTTGGTYPQNQILIGPESTKVKATNNTAASIATATPTVLTYDNEDFDTLSEFTNGTGVFTPKNAGYYKVDASAMSASVSWTAGTHWEVDIYKNGTIYISGDYSTSDATTTRQRVSKVSALVYCNGTTDYIDSRITHNQGGNVALDTAPTHNYFIVTRE